MLLSEKNTGQWRPVVPPRILRAAPESVAQHQKLANQKIRTFLGAADLKDGSILDLEPRRVPKDGTLSFLNEKTGEADRICCHGYRALAGQEIFGAIIKRGPEKRMYFWPSVAARETRGPAIVPAGHQVAKKNGNDWAPVPLDPDWGRRKLNAAVQQYGKFIFATVGQKVLEDTWPVRQTTQQQKWTYQFVARQIRGRQFAVYLTDLDGIGRELFSRTREIAGQLKLTEFWRTAEDRESNRPALFARFVAFRPLQPNGQGNGWLHFWHRLTDVQAFQSLIAAELITPHALSELLADEFLNHRYGVQVTRVVDALKLDRINL